MSPKLALAAILALAACTAPPPVNSATTGPAGLGDPFNAIQYTSWAFAYPARTRNDPVSAARAVAALDYLAGYLQTAPNARGMNPIISDQMVTAREAVRQTLGIAPTAPSQLVVNVMDATASDLSAGNRPAALQALSSPAFTLGPERTLATLTNLPYIRMANIATGQAFAAITGNCIICNHGGAL